MSMPVRGLAVVAALCAALCAVTSCTPRSTVEPAGPVEDVGLGLLAPLSGPDAAIGAEQRRGAELAVEVVNDDEREADLPLGAGSGLPRLRGAQLRLSVADTAGDPDAAGREAEDLVTEAGPVALIGGDREAVIAAASQRAERLRVPLVDTGTSAAYLTELGLDWYFRATPSDRTLGAAAFGLLVRPLGGGAPARRVTLVQPADGRHADLAAALEELAGEAGVEVAAVVRADAGAAGYRQAGAAAAGSDAAAVLAVAATREDAVALTAELRERAPKRPLVGLGPGFADPDFLARAGDAADGVLRPAPWSTEFATRNRAARVADDLHRRRFGTPMTAAAAGAFTAVLLLATAIDDAGARTPAGVRAALLAADVPGTRLIMPWIGVQFGPGGQNERADAVVEQVVDGQPRVVHPAELATAPLTWPEPAKGAR